jgi:hypothetical protein
MAPPWELLAAAVVLAMLIVGATIGVLWLAGVMFRAIASLFASRVRAAPAFPVQLLDEGAGQYRVEGVIRPTEEEVIWLVDARTRANAIAKAEIRGAVVTRVVKVATVEAEDLRPVSIESMEHQPVTSA